MKYKIALIDDREDLREENADLISDAIVNLDLQDRWEVIAPVLLKEKENYLRWIDENNIKIFIVDEKLGQVPGPSHIAYSGSDLVELIRSHYKQMPIYALTNYVKDQQILDRFALFDEVIHKTEFSGKEQEYIQRFVRAYESFSLQREKELSELSEISKKIAEGSSSFKDRKRALAIQKTLEIEITTEETNSRRVWLESYEKSSESFSKLLLKIKNHLEKKK